MESTETPGKDNRRKVFDEVKGSFTLYRTCTISVNNRLSDPRDGGTIKEKDPFFYKHVRYQYSNKGRETLGRL